jgi:hypothetical protein
MTSAKWREWFEEIVRSATDRQQLSRANPGSLPGPVRATDRWPFEDHVRTELLRLWPSYLRHMKQRSEEEFDRAVARHQSLARLDEKQVQEQVERQRWLWDQMQQFRPLPALYFYVVDYPSRLVEAVPPASIVLAGVDEEEDTDDRNEMLLEGARRLKAADEL